VCLGVPDVVASVVICLVLSWKFVLAVDVGVAIVVCLFVVDFVVGFDEEIKVLHDVHQHDLIIHALRSVLVVLLLLFGGLVLVVGCYFLKLLHYFLVRSIVCDSTMMIHEMTTH
tara:strand:- start:92 stop:433 length:342 start_codon:yes stop_codon:yes gene_type:complete